MVLAGVREGRPTCLPRLYVFDEGASAVYVHGPWGGEVAAMTRKEGWVSLVVFEMGRILPAGEAAEFDVEYAGVIVTGTARVVEDPREAGHALDLFMRKYAPHLHPGTDYRAASGEDIARTAVVRVDIETWSGKENALSEDAPGAYRLSEVRASS